MQHLKIQHILLQLVNVDDNYRILIPMASPMLLYYHESDQLTVFQLTDNLGQSPTVYGLYLWNFIASISIFFLPKYYGRANVSTSPNSSYWLCVVFYSIPFGMYSLLILQRKMQSL